MTDDNPRDPRANSAAAARPATSGQHGFRLFTVAVLAPLAFAIAGVLVTVALAASGPARVATHWGFSGPPNGFGSPYTYPILIAVISVALIVLLGGSAVLAAHRSPLTGMLKVLAIAPLWVTVLLDVSLGGSLLEQRTSASVSTAANPALALVIGVVIASVLSVGAWFLLPKAVRSPAADEPVTVSPVLLADGESASWVRTTSASRGVLLIFVGIGVILGAAEILVVLSTGGRAWWFSIIPVVVLIILLSNLAFTVRIDSRGTRIRSVVGIPSISIPLRDMESARVIEVNALSQYGGWGIRWNLSGRLGIIVRSGQALEIHRRRGLIVVVTVDDATSAAGLINGLVQRQSAGQ
jgi:hypothetical protein